MDPFAYQWVITLGPVMYALVGAVIGDGFFVIIGFLQAQEVISDFWPAFFAFVGLYVSDLIFYFIGGSKYFTKLKRRKRAKKIIERFNLTIDFITGENLLIALFYSKFISGAKLVMNIYFGEKGIPIKKFLILNFLMAVFWTIVTWIIGYLSGEGVSWVLKYFESITIAALVAVIIAIILFNISKTTKRYLEGRYNNKEH